MAVPAAGVPTPQRIYKDAVHFGYQDQPRAWFEVKSAAEFGRDGDSSVAVDLTHPLGHGFPHSRSPGPAASVVVVA